MERVIAANTKHTGDPRRDHRGYAESMTSEQVDSLLSEDWLRKMVHDIWDGNEKAKDALPYICPHYSAFRNNHRAQADIIPEAFTFMTCVDVDDKELVEKAIGRALELNRDEYSDWKGQVLRIAYSAHKKVHIYIRIPKGMTIEEAQRAFCQELEVPFDESCVTPERFIYVTGKDEEVYRSEHWLEPLPEEEIAERIYHPSESLVRYRYSGAPFRPYDLHPFIDLALVSEKHDTRGSGKVAGYVCGECI